MTTETYKSLLGYLASAVFGGMSLMSAILSALQLMTAAVGFCGAVVGLLGAYYTVRIQRRRFRNPKEGDRG